MNPPPRRMQAVPLLLARGGDHRLAPGMQQRWSEQQLYYPPVTDVVLRLIALLIAAFAVQWLAASFFYPEAGVARPFEKIVADNALQFGPGFSLTQILTHPLLYPSSFFPGALLQLLFDCLLLYFFGAELERTWGRHNFLRFFLIGLTGGALLGAALSLLPPTLLSNRVSWGADAGLAATMTAYAILWPDRQVLLFFVIPVRMKWLVLIILALSALFGSQMRVVLYSGGAVTAALFLYYYARRGRNQSVYAPPSAPAKGKPGLRERWNEYWRKRRLRRKQEEINQRIAMKNEVDRLLEKISRQGMDSLSRKEKAFLDRASKEF